MTRKPQKLSRAKQKRVSLKIAKLRREGDEPEQAAAKAYSMARAGRLTPKGGYLHVGRKRKRSSK
jgi:hypothetical protein